MYLYNKLIKLTEKKKYIVFVDMDGVIASYDFGNPLDFINKRPLLSNINKLEDINKIENIELKILSVCRKTEQIEEKNIWLDKYAPFFLKENRVIICKELNPGFKSDELKANYLSTYYEKENKILIDDDNMILKYVSANVPNIICIQDSELVD